MEGKTETAEKEKIIRAYLSTATSLIVDQNSSARVGLKKLLVQMGQGLNSVHLAGTVEEAEEIIREKKPCLIFCDYQIQGKYGLDLMQKQRQEFPKETGTSLFLLVTGNTSQSAVAQAAEEDIDAYILKPYTYDGFVLSVSRAIQMKLQPSEYLNLISKGKDLLGTNKLDDAMSIFDEAMTKDSKPSLACFYEGMINFKKSLLDGSEESYAKGLSFSKIHYKCLVGMFDLLVSLKKYDAAYDVVLKLVKFFPSNPKRLASVLRLAIQTKHYADVESFYQEFMKIEERSEELVKCVCAALIVCGRYFLEINETAMGVDLIKKATVSAAGNHYLLRKSIENLVRFNQAAEAKAALFRFTNPDPEDLHFAVSSLMVSSLESKPELAASQGQDLIKKGVVEIDVYLITLSCLEKIGLHERAQELREEGAKLYPVLLGEAKLSA